MKKKKAPITEQEFELLATFGDYIEAELNKTISQ